jgi:hypothetical protein
MPSPIEGPFRAPGNASANRHYTDVLIIVGGPRERLMHPRKTLPIKEAIVSTLAGDIYGNVPIRGSLRLYKGLICLTSLLDLRRSISAAWRRSQHTRVGVLAIPVQC